MMRFALTLFVLGVVSLRASSTPNVLFLFADDMTWKAVNALSDEDIDTPNLDRLAARGMTFSHAYNSGGWHGAICVASRTMLNTGKQLWKAKAAEKTLEREYVAKDRTWAQLLAKEGYRTCFSGKWHMQMDADGVFEQIRNERPGGMPKDGENAYERPVEGKPDPWSAWDPKEGGFWEGGKHWSEVIADDFGQFLAVEDDRPWFMYLAFNAPHDPRQAPKEILDQYPLERIELPKNFLPVYPYRKPMKATQSLRDERLAPSPRTPFAVKTHRREYYAIITHLDAQIGRILDQLDASPDAKETFICFTADHGLACGEHGLLGKQNLYDASVRVPFIIAGPGIPAGKVTREPIYLQDVMPTTLELAGAEVPESVDFDSLVPFWKGRPERTKAVYGAYMNSQRMIEMEGKKLILYPAAKVARVFDMNADPDEMNDLYGTEEGERLAKRLFAGLLALQKEMSDPLDLRSVYPDLQ